MKKILSLFIVCMLLVGTMIILTGCGNNNQSSINPSNNLGVNSNPSDNNNNGSLVVNKLKAEKALASLSTDNYYVKLITDAEDDAGNIIRNATMEITVEGKNFATDIKAAGYGMIVKDDAMYYIMHDAKQYTKMDLQPNTKQEMLKEFSDKNFTDNFVTSGQEELNGTKYYYEEFNFESETARLYFDNDTLKYIESKYSDGTPTTIIEIVEISDKSKKSLFEIPEGYTSLEMNF